MSLKKQTSGSICLITSIVFALIGFIIFIINSTTGYLAGSQIQFGTLILSIIALVFGVLLFLFRNSMEKYETLISIVIGLFLSIATVLFVESRVYLAADVWFIPVNYPESEEVALWISIAGVASYVLSIITLAISTTLGIESKKEEIKIIEE